MSDERAVPVTRAIKSFDFKRKLRIQRLHNFFPIIKWLPQYKWREYLLADMMSGFIVGVAGVPQGLARVSHD